MKDRMDLIRHIFTFNIMVTRKWEVLFNRAHPKDDLTLKQMMVLIIVAAHSGTDLAVTEVAAILGTSHQNLKALANQLEKKDFITVYKDDLDRRVNRIRLLPGKESYWANRNDKDAVIMESLFEGVSDNDLQITLNTIMKLNSISDEML